MVNVASQSCGEHLRSHCRQEHAQTGQHRHHLNHLQGRITGGEPLGPTFKPQDPTLKPQGPTSKPQGPTPNTQGSTLKPQGPTLSP